MKGLFITFEGIEGSGKSTQAKLLKERLERQSIPVLLTREPGGSRIAETIRQILLSEDNQDILPVTELLLYEAARAQHVDEIIRPALEKGVVVISDRFADSTTAYQGAGRSIDLETIELLHKIATRGIWPDVTVILDLPVNEGLERIKALGRLDRLEQEPESFHERVRQYFLSLANRERERARIVDGRRDPDVIAEEVWTVVKKFLPRFKSE